MTSAVISRIGSIGFFCASFVECRVFSLSELVSPEALLLRFDQTRRYVISLSGVMLLPRSAKVHRSFWDLYAELWLSSKQVCLVQVVVFDGQHHMGGLVVQS